MAKPGDKPQTAQAAPTITAGAGRSSTKPIQIDVTPEVFARCRKDLHAKLTQHVTTGHEGGDVGIISKIVADIRALDLIEPTRIPIPPEPNPPDPPEIAARKAAAADDAKMQEYNAQVRRKEAIDAERSEARAE